MSSGDLKVGDIVICFNTRRNRGVGKIEFIFPTLGNWCAVLWDDGSKVSMVTNYLKSVDENEAMLYRLSQ